MHCLNHNRTSLRLILAIIAWGFAIAPTRSEAPAIRTTHDIPPLPQSSGSLQDLRQLESRSPLDWSWQETLSESQPKSSPPYIIDAHTRPHSVNPIQEFEEWKRLNQGDPKRDSPSIPLSAF